MQMQWNSAARAAKKRRKMMPHGSKLGLLGDEGDEARNDIEIFQRSVQSEGRTPEDALKHSKTLQAEGNNFAEAGNFHEALQKWESAIRLTPDRGVLHEQKAQICLELGASWQAVQAASRATELEPEWAEVWITLGRAQVNYGETTLAVESFRKALQIQPQNEEGKADLAECLRLEAKKVELNHSASTSQRWLFGSQLGLSERIPLLRATVGGFEEASRRNQGSRAIESESNGPASIYQENTST